MNAYFNSESCGYLWMYRIIRYLRSKVLGKKADRWLVMVSYRATLWRNDPLYYRSTQPSREKFPIETSLCPSHYLKGPTVPIKLASPLLFHLVMLISKMCSFRKCFTICMLTCNLYQWILDNPKTAALRSSPVFWAGRLLRHHGTRWSGWACTHCSYSKPSEPLKQAREVLHQFTPTTQLVCSSPILGTSVTQFRVISGRPQFRQQKGNPTGDWPCRQTLSPSTSSCPLSWNMQRENQLFREKHSQNENAIVQYPFFLSELFYVYFTLNNLSSL